MGMTPMTSRVIYWENLVSAKVLKKGLLMSHGKTLELGFLGLRGK
jgi:hypothetical protein